MKAGLLAVAAAMVVGDNCAGNAGHLHAHEAFHMKRNMVTGTSPPGPGATCGCTTIYTTVTGSLTIVHPTTPVVPVYESTSTPAPTVPTPIATVLPTPGTYTIPATTLTLTETVTTCAAATTSVTAGDHTYGGVTTIVKTSTEVVCPYATVVTESGVVTSTIKTTTTVCPMAGTYVIGGTTTKIPYSTVLVYPIPATYAPGTYTQPATVLTVTKHKYVYVCPYTSQAPAPTSTYVAPPPAKTTEAPAPPKYEAPAIKYEAPKVEYKAPPKKSEAPKKSSAPSGGLGVPGDMWGLTYTPYNEDKVGDCKSADTIESDIKLIASKGFTAIRIYSTDCRALELIPQHCHTYGLKMIVGVFIDGSGIGGAQEQIDALVKWADWSLVVLVVIGNEALDTYPPRASPSELAGFISSCKSALRGAKYTGPVTTAEPLNKWQEDGNALCDVVDVVGLNLHPYFNQDVDASSAGSFAKNQLDIASNICPGKDAYALETGWPNKPNQCNGKACAGPSEQATAIHGIMKSIGGKSIMFSYKNDGWKEPGPYNVEDAWGCIDLF